MSSTAEERPIFVVGFPRSGTTLMRSVLNAHPRIAIAPETHFLTDFAGHIHGRALGKDGFETFWSKFSRSERFQSLALNGPQLRTSIIQTGDFRLRSIFKSILAQYSEQNNKVRYGEKTPRHYEHLVQLLDWFPRAQVIYMIRDPRAVCASLMGVWWRKWQNRGFRVLEPLAMTRIRRAYFDSKSWESQARGFRENWESDTRVKKIIYESLVENAEYTIRDVCAFLGEEYSPAMLQKRSDPDAEARVLTSGKGRKGEWRKAHLQNVAEPVYADALEKWRVDLSQLEIRTIESNCPRGMQWLGYVREAHAEKIDYKSRLSTELVSLYCRFYWNLAKGRRSVLAL